MKKTPKSLRYLNIKHCKYKGYLSFIIKYVYIIEIIRNKLQNYLSNIKNLFLLLIILLIFIRCKYISHDIIFSNEFIQGYLMKTLNSSSLMTNECKLCNFSLSNENFTKPNSSERDIILSIAIGAIFNIYPFIKTLRTTQCKARIVIFIDSLTFSSMNYSYFEEISKCGVQFIDIGDKVPTEAEDIFYYRYVLYNQFLKENQQEINRVILVDLFDTVFQHDPFTTNFSEDLLYLSDEGYSLMNSLFNTIQIRRNILNMSSSIFNDPSIYKENYLKKIRYKHILNGGLQGGGLLPILSFLSLMTKIGDKNKMKAIGDDQAFINIFAYSKLLKNICKFEIIPSSSYFMSSNALYCMLEKNSYGSNYKFGNFSRGNKIPAILHQYNRCHNIKEDLLRVCPNDNNIPYYVI